MKGLAEMVLTLKVMGEINIIFMVLTEGDNREYI